MVVLDSWALLAYLAGEPAAERIEAAWLDEGAAICSVNLGEVLYIRIRGGGEEAAVDDVETARRHLDVVEPDWALVVAAAKPKARGGLSTANAFCVSTAERLRQPLWTGDAEIVDRAGDQGCEVVDLRSAAA